MRKNYLTVLITLVAVIAPALVWAIYRLAPESAPVARGADYAAYRGCIECHGNPQRPLPEITETACANSNRMPLHLKYDAPCADVLAYFEANRLLRRFDQNAPVDRENLLAAGEHIARKYYCFQCHGQLGQGGFQNAGSLKGYVPGYFGTDFKLMTNNGDPDSVRKWIAYGRDPAFLEGVLTGRIAKYFFNRQAIRMPSYKSLDQGELDILVNYVIALNNFGPMTAASVRSYAEQAD